MGEENHCLWSAHHIFLHFLFIFFANVQVSDYLHSTSSVVKAARDCALIIYEIAGCETFVSEMLKFCRQQQDTFNEILEQVKTVYKDKTPFL